MGRANLGLEVSCVPGGLVGGTCGHQADQPCRARKAVDGENPSETRREEEGRPISNRTPFPGRSAPHEASWGKEVHWQHSLLWFQAPQSAITGSCPGFTAHSPEGQIAACRPTALNRGWPWLRDTFAGGHPLDALMPALNGG